jgi:hypothetical protein
MIGLPGRHVTGMLSPIVHTHPAPYLGVSTDLRAGQRFYRRIVTGSHPALAALRRCRMLLLAAAAAAALSACGPTDQPISAGASTPPASPSTAATVSANASFCDMIIEANTSVGYMVDKHFQPTLAPDQMEKLVNLVLLRQNDIAAAAQAAGVGDLWSAVLPFYQAVAAGRAADADYYVKYLNNDPATLQALVAKIGPGFVTAQKALAQYEKQTCGITFANQ